MCSGSRTRKENVSAICWCAVKMWVRNGVTKTVVLLLNNVNGIRKHVECISVDALSCCKFYSVVEINSANYYQLYNSHYSKLPLSPLAQWRYQLGSPSIILLHTFSVNISALSHCQVGDKQEWCDNRDYIIVQFATLLPCNCLYENYSAFNKT